jgi:hypothetical protein
MGQVTAGAFLLGCNPPHFQNLLEEHRDSLAHGLSPSTSQVERGKSHNVHKLQQAWPFLSFLSETLRSGDIFSNV